MASLALAFDILAKDKGASRTFQDVGNAAESAGMSGESAGRRLGNGLRAGALAAAAGLAAAGAGAVKFVGQASDAAESANAVRVVFGKSATEIEALGKSAATALGLSATEFNSLAVRFSSFATTISGPGGDVASTLDDLTTRAADFASVMNLDVAQAAELFQSGLAGETEPLRAFGLDLSAAAVEAYAAANGIGTLGQQLTEAEKVTARYGLLMQSTAQTQGDFANTSDSLANRQRVLAAQFDNIQATLGTALLPLFESMAGVLTERVVPAVQTFITEFQNGEGAGGKFRDILAEVGDKATKFGGFLRDEVYPRLVEFRDFVRDEVVPRVQSFADKMSDLRDRFEKQVLPKLREVSDYLVETFTPTFQALVDLYEDNLKPAIERITEKFKENEPQLRKVWQVVGLVAGAVFYLYTQFLSNLLPILIKVGGYLIDTLVGAFEKASDAQAAMVDIVTDLYEGFQNAKDFAGDFIDKIKGIEVPKPLRDIADIIERIAEGIGGAASGVAGFVRDRVGDAAGSFRGTLIGGGGSGTALSRVQSILPAGLSITSTYRSPAHNASVGGSPTSKHMDRNNPAVDIAGPVGLMDAFAGQLAQIGGWRQLLYRVAGHYDHIHVAHSGGVVSSSWHRSPGDRADERTTRLQVGETVIPKGGSVGGPSFSVGQMIVADPQDAVRAMRSELKIQQSLDAQRMAVFA